MSDKMIYINDYISFDTENGWFILSREAQEILYRQKHLICSYSGCVEWGYNFFCELLDLYSGGSQYNFALGTVIHKYELEEAYKAGHVKEVIDWVNRKKEQEWFKKAADMLVKIIDDVPEMEW